MLFYKDTGEISPQVYDVQLYSILKKSVPGQGQQFYEAVMIRGEKIKNEFHKKILGIDKGSSTNTCEWFLKGFWKLSIKAQSYDQTSHPRVPVLLKHNKFVRDTFLKVKQGLDYMENYCTHPTKFFQSPTMLSL